VVLTAFFRKKLIVALLMLTFLLIIAPILPQEDAPTPPVISAENIHQLQSIAKIDLADYKDDFGEFITGWFAVDENGTQFVTSSEQRDLIVFTESGEVTYEFNLAPGHLNADDAATAMLVDAVFGDEDTLITLFDGTTAQRNVDEDGETQFASIPIAYIVDHGDNMDSVEIVHMINTVGKSVWLDDDSQIGIEATQYDTETPSEVVYFFPTEQRNRTLSLPYAPA